MMTTKIRTTKPKTKKVVKTKKTGKPIGKYTGITLPLPNMSETFERSKDFIIEIAKQINSENESLAKHKDNSFFSVEDLWAHLSNTNILLDRMLYLVIQLMHDTYHTDATVKDIGKLKKTLQEVDTDLKKHKPKLEYIDQKVQEHQQSEEKAKQIYG